MRGEVGRERCLSYNLLSYDSVSRTAVIVESYMFRPA